MTNPNDTSFPIFDQDGARSGCAGLTKREYFAAMAMQGLLGNSDLSGEDTETYALWAVENADALIKSLNA